jgi:hypothetical protein
MEEAADTAKGGGKKRGPERSGPSACAIVEIARLLRAAGLGSISLDLPVDELVTRRGLAGE